MPGPWIAQQEIVLVFGQAVDKDIALLAVGTILGSLLSLVVSIFTTRSTLDRQHAHEWRLKAEEWKQERERFAEEFNASRADREHELLVEGVRLAEAYKKATGAEVGMMSFVATFAQDRLDHGEPEAAAAYREAMQPMLDNVAAERKDVRDKHEDWRLRASSLEELYQRQTAALRDSSRSLEQLVAYHRSADAARDAGSDPIEGPPGDGGPPSEDDRTSAPDDG